MDKKKLYIIGGILLLFIAGLSVWYFGFASTEKINEDAVRFKEEYEAYNGKEAYGDATYQELEISEDSKIKYATAKEIIKILESGTGLIYLGFPTCPWCRGLIPALLDAVDCSCLENVTYLNVSDLRDTYTLEDGKPVKTKDTSDEYYRILELLDEYLLDYTLTSDDGKEINVGEKRLYVPMVVAVKDGKIIDTRIDSVELDENQSPFDTLKDSQYKELKTDFTDMIDQITKEASVCEDHC